MVLKWMPVVDHCIDLLPQERVRSRLELDRISRRYLPNSFKPELPIQAAIRSRGTRIGDHEGPDDLSMLYSSECEFDKAAINCCGLSADDQLFALYESSTSASSIVSFSVMQRLMGAESGKKRVSHRAWLGQEM